jgi:hypothetical protein
MVDSSPKKGSQFAGAAALFQKKESDLKIKEEEQAKNKPEKRKGSQFSGAAAIFQRRAGASAGDLNVTMSPPVTSKRSSLKLPSFVSPGPGAAKSEAEKGWKSRSSEPSPLPFGSSPGGNYSTSSYHNKPSESPVLPPKKDKRPSFSTNNYPTTSYLNKGATVTVTPTQKKKPSVAAGFNRLPFTPSPSSDKPKLTSQSWKDKGISFQASSPQTVKKPSVAPTYYGGSYINTSADTKTTKPAKPTKPKFSSSGLQQFEDTKIQVKIPDIDKKIRARRAAAAAQIPPPKSNNNGNVPEHMKKFREREERRLAALDEKQRKAEEKIQAVFLGWWVRAKLPRIKAENEERLRRQAEERKERLRRQAEERALQKLRYDSSTKIQALFRGFFPRKEFKRLIIFKRRCDANEKRMKEIEKEIKKMPKTIKTDIKALKEEYKLKKKEMKKKVKEEMKAEEKKIEEMKKEGSNMIQYMQEENRKLRGQKATLKKDIKTLEKQADVLKEKQDEIEARFNSLRGFAEKKNVEVKKREINSQKCRTRYLPKYRAEMADRNKHCLQEYRVKMLYKTRLYRIVEELQAKSKDPELVEETVEALEELEEELNEFPEIPVPEGLANWLN